MVSRTPQDSSCGERVGGYPFPSLPIGHISACGIFWVHGEKYPAHPHQEKEKIPPSRYRHRFVSIPLALTGSAPRAFRSRRPRPTRVMCAPKEFPREVHLRREMDKRRRGCQWLGLGLGASRLTQIALGLLRSITCMEFVIYYFKIITVYSIEIRPD